MSAILEIHKLSKHYPGLHAVKEISFSIPKGICFGLLGPNGAGKTTTLEMIEGITPSSSGEIYYKGKLRDKNFSHEIGIQFQETALPDFLSVKETLNLFSSFYRKTLPLDTLITDCTLGDFIQRASTSLSGGQRQRLLLALALINDPELVFLDEPTTGLDPQSRRNFWQLIESIKQQGKTVLLTTHYMDEAEYLCDDLIIMDHGQILDRGSPRQLLDKYFNHTSIHLEQHLLQDKALDLDLGQDEIIYNSNKAIILSQSPEQTISQLIAHNIDLSSLSVQKPTLEDLFIKLTGHQLRH